MFKPIIIIIMILSNVVFWSHDDKKETINIELIIFYFLYANIHLNYSECTAPIFTSTIIEKLADCLDTKNGVLIWNIKVDISTGYSLYNKKKFMCPKIWSLIIYKMSEIQNLK